MESRRSVPDKRISERAELISPENAIDGRVSRIPSILPSVFSDKNGAEKTQRKLVMGKTANRRNDRERLPKLWARDRGYSGNGMERFEEEERDS